MKTVIWMFAVVTGIMGGFQAGTIVASRPVTETVLSIPSSTGAPDEMLTVPLPKEITAHQQGLLEVAYDIADRDGIQPPQLLQGILMQESRAGDLSNYKVAGPPGHHYYGVAQIKLDAARDVLKRFPGMWDQYGFQTHADEEIVAKLIENDQFNIAVASKYLVILHGYGYHSPKALSVAYNKGPGGAAGVTLATDPYAAGVSGHMRALKPRPATVSGVYHVREGDSLSKIALTIQNGVPLGKVMDAVYRANPQAFIGGDQDMLMAGVDLKLPKLS